MKSRSYTCRNFQTSRPERPSLRWGLFCVNPKNLPRPASTESHDPKYRAELSNAHAGDLATPLTPQYPPYHRSKLSTLAAALATPPKNTRRSCGVSTWLASLPLPDQEAAKDAFASIQWKTTQLFEVFKAQGFPGQTNIVSKHRLGRCSCL